MGAGGYDAGRIDWSLSDGVSRAGAQDRRTLAGLFSLADAELA